LEQAYPGAVGIFLTGCTGDANTGHSAHASLSLVVNDERSFATAERLGGRIGALAAAAPETPVGDTVGVGNMSVTLGLARREAEPLLDLAARWQQEMLREPAKAGILQQWISWAERNAGITDPAPWIGRVTMLDWGGVPIVALPGEIFAETGLSIRDALNQAPAFVISYADAVPGYIPPASEFRFGGYEVDEAHRYIGMPATFAPGSAEALADAARVLLSARRRMHAM
jgi:hypothetical protein